MSLEAAVLANTAAIETLTAAVLASNEGRAAAIETLAGSGAAAVPPKPRGRPAKAEVPAAVPVAPSDAPPSADEFRTAMGKFMDTTDEAVRKGRREFVKSVLDHFGAKLLMEIPAENFAKVLGWSDEFLAGKTPNFSEGEDDAPVAEEDPDDLMG